MKLLTTVDFESEAIRDRPRYPPHPVSVAIWEPGKKPEFWAWGHPAGNNCTRPQVKARLRSTWNGSRDLLFHNAKFDLDVAETHLGLRPPPWHQIHDTEFQLFLNDPNAPGLDLKGSAERVLGIEPKARDELREWLLAHMKDQKKGVGTGCRAIDLLKPSQAFAHIACAPGDLVAPYAIADVKLTRALHEYLHSKVQGEAYDRERRVLYPLLEMERRGLPVEIGGLQNDYFRGHRLWNQLDNWIRERLHAPDLNVGKPEQLCNAMEDADVVKEWILTATDRRSTSYESLREVCSDRQLVDVLKFRNILRTQVRTFVEPWLAQATQTGGRTFCSFNQCRRAEERRMGKSVGARTGRLSTFPNFLNVPSSQPPIATTELQWKRIQHRGDALYIPIRGAQLLDLRSRVRAPRGWLLGDHDYDGQELRMFTHFAGGPLAEAYRKDPRTKGHKWVAAAVAPTLGKLYPHRVIKNTNFGILYGEGLALLSSKLNCSEEEASLIRKACRGVLLSGDLDKTLQAAGECTTWGGRVCPVEPTTVVNGEFREWGYKLINTLVQGSAGDQIKEAIILVDEDDSIEAELLLSVYDELLWQAPSRRAAAQVAPIRKKMESLELSVPLIAEGKVGRTWRDTK